jgi:CBS domain-containing protein
MLAILALQLVCRRCTASPWAAFGLSLAIALPLVVLVTEVTAKTLAAKAPLGWSRVCILPLSAFALAVTPVRVIVQGITSVLLRPFGDAARARPTKDLSEAEFRKLVDAGSAQGQVDARERRLIHRVFEFSDKNVGQVMTPRERIFAVSYDLPMQRLVKEIASRGFSRVPIYQKSLDNIRGIVNAKDLVRAAAGQPLGRPLNDILHEPLFVPRTTPVKRLFLTFKQKKVHMAVVVSEYGKVLGLVTMDDLLAQIFGVLRDERAALQQSIPPGRLRVRTPVAGTTAGDATGPVVRESFEGPRGDTGPIAQLDTGPVPREIVPPDRDTGPLPRIDTDLLRTRDTGEEPVAEPVDVLDPPRLPRTISAHHSGKLPIYPPEEHTPPAADVSEFGELGPEDKSS